MHEISDQSWLGLVDEIKKIIESEHFELWDIEYKSERGSMVLRVFIEKPAGVTVDHCAHFSQQISMLLDVENYIKGKYVLEVSSPGMDRKLVKPEHYERYLGHEVKISLNPSIVGRKKFNGKLESCEDGHLKIFDGNERQHYVLNLSDVEIAKLEI